METVSDEVFIQSVVVTVKKDKRPEQRHPERKVSNAEPRQFNGTGSENHKQR